MGGDDLDGPRSPGRSGKDSVLCGLGRGREFFPSLFCFQHFPPSPHLSLPPPVPSTYWLLDSPISMATGDSQLPCPHLTEPRGERCQWWWLLGALPPWLESCIEILEGGTQGPRDWVGLPALSMLPWLPPPPSCLLPILPLFSFFPSLLSLFAQSRGFSSSQLKSFPTPAQAREES